MYEENSDSNKVGRFIGLCIFLFGGVITGFGLLGMLVAAKWVLIQLGVQF